MRKSYENIRNRKKIFEKYRKSEENTGHLEKIYEKFARPRSGVSDPELLISYYLSLINLSLIN